MAVADEVTVSGSAIYVGNMLDFDEKSDENSDQTALKCVDNRHQTIGGTNFQDFVPILCIFFYLDYGKDGSEFEEFAATRKKIVFLIKICTNVPKYDGHLV